jgi:hypothetical protein
MKNNLNTFTKFIYKVHISSVIQINIKQTTYLNIVKVSYICHYREIKQ